MDATPIDHHDQAEIEPIAVIGMACRVPGADGIDQFWANLRDGVESIRRIDHEVARAAGASERTLADPQYVLANPILDGVEDFDANLFGCTRREAEILDPQHRVLLECAVAALDHAGYDPARYDGDIGVYGGVGAGEYQWYHLLPDKGVVAAVGAMAIALANNPDYAATYVSYKLNLRGPSLSVSTACSTGLVAVHLACEAVRNGECDMALAGGVSIELTQWRGYQYQEGSILSPDGHCRAFDADAGGTLWGSGGGMVLLKRLSDAIADGDTVHAVILGSAINNDGSDKVGFSAPSVSGQSAVIRQAMGVANADPSSIDYIEAHGTGTTVGDPIEVRALNLALGESLAPGSIGLGTVKPNIGHLAAGAGAAGLIKTILSLENETIPPTLHFRRLNPAIDAATTPLRVVSERQEWPRNGRPRRAGVSSFGMGGTNAHAVLQEAPEPVRVPASGTPQVITLSAQTPTALSTMSAALVEHLRAHPELVLDDVAHTLQVGRRPYPYRRALVASSIVDAADVLDGSSPRRLFVGKVPTSPRTVFLFPGQGTQRVGMAAQLYHRSAIVRHWIDAGADLLTPLLGLDLRTLVFADAPNAEDAGAKLNRTSITQPALFVVEYALAKFWESMGVGPAAMLGHSLGEYVAACLANVFTFEDGLRVVAARASLMDAMVPGAMLALPIGQSSVDLEGTGLELAAVNAPMACVVSGPIEAVAAYQQQCDELGLPATRLRTSHAFHSRLMEPAREALTSVLGTVSLQPPRIPVVSNVTGGWLTPEQATDPAYWADHMTKPVLYGPGLQTLLADAPSVLLEVGVGHALGDLARMQLPSGTPDPVPTLPAAGDDEEAVRSAAARLWTLGVAVDFSGLHPVPRRRLPLPGHPFERERHWIEAVAGGPAGLGGSGAVVRAGREEMEDWFWVPSWRQTPSRPAGTDVDLSTGPWVVLRDPDGGIDPLVARLRAGARVVTVTPGDRFTADDDAYTVRPDVPADFEQLVDGLLAAGVTPSIIVDAWPLSSTAVDPLNSEAARRALPLAFSSLLWLVQALASHGLTEDVRLSVLTHRAQAVIGGDVASPVQALTTGPVRAIPMEFPDLTIRQIDLDSPDGAADAVLAELDGDDELVAYRNGRRWLPALEPAPVAAPAADRAGLRERGVYLITGGLGGIGLSIAEDLARRARARLVLVSRSELPPRERWAELAGRDDRLGRQLSALRRIEACGASVMTVAADISDPHQVGVVRDRVIVELGEVNGIVHAAGLPGGTMIEAQNAVTAAAVLEPKVFGTLALADAFRDVPLDFLALCSSVTAIAGGFGQVDYCAGNAFMDAFAHAAERVLAFPVLSLNWGAWLEVGMAVETVAPDAFRVVERGETRSALPHPLLDVAETAEGERQVRCTVELSAADSWVVREHQILGTPALPGTAYLELARAAFARNEPERPVELRDVVFLTPLSVPEGTHRTARIVLEDGIAGGPWRVESWTNGASQIHAHGTVHWADPSQPAATDIDAVRRRCDRVETGVSLQDSASGLLTFGPRWSSLEEVRVGRTEELAWLVAGDTVAEELASYGLHPAMLDEATAFGEFDVADGAYLPLGYGRVTVRRPMPARVYSHLRHRETGTPELLTCDITLLDEQGVAVVDIADFMLRRVDPGDLGELAGSADPTVAAAVEDPVRSSVSDGGDVGIRPGEGAEAFVRALGARLGPQVVITARHLPTLIQAVRAADRRQVDEALSDQLVAGTSTLGLDEDYVAPSTDLERVLVELWEEAMGVKGIGVEHDFFALGGNSLVATQLASRIKATTGVRLPMRVFFESATIAGMATMIEQSAAAVA